ncbi:AMP-binding protein [Actinomadura macra]|uniref:AMP-binding protein n=1 Tax=Actinomadura macra TaxID=46164 RepID=UPI0008370A63|nr:AMP-binding protein [Actinomadura macra]
MLDMLGHRTLTDLLAERVARYPDKPWLICENDVGEVTRYSYARFAEETRAVAGGLRDLGIVAGDRVALALGNSPEFVVAYFAVIRIGAVVVPCNVRDHPAEIAYVIERAGARLLIGSDAMLERLADVLPGTDQLLRVGRWAWDGLRTAKPWDGRAEAGDEDPVQILFTSGTTSRPKGVLITHANCIFAGEMVVRSYLLDDTDRLLTALPLYHLNAQALSMLAALTAGGTLIVLESYHASAFWARIREYDATQTSLVGMLVRTLLAQPPAATDRRHRLRRVPFALNVTDEERAAFEERFAVELINGYGLSEAVAGVSVCPVSGPKRWPSIGLPAMERRVRLVRDDGEEAGPGEVGEIEVHGVPGRTLMLGYYLDPGATAAAMSDGWLRTGDYATADAAGYLYFFDRKKDVIKRAGESISASEVEAVLAGHPQVARAAVVGVPDPIRDEAVMAVLEPVPGAAPDEAELLAYCRQRLASYKVPSIVEFRAELPLTTVGKIDKRLLRADARKRPS